jgi:hypothetical protein
MRSQSGERAVRKPSACATSWVSKSPVTGELLRGTLLERVTRHRSGCPKCARREYHKVFVLTVTYPGHRTCQISVRRERVEEVRRWLANYQEMKETVEAICQLNHDLLRPNGRRQNRGRSRMIESRRHRPSNPSRIGFAINQLPGA